ncbi:MAG TPA: glycosyltransferase [Cyclobacteriaceae bacterium]
MPNHICSKPTKEALMKETRKNISLITIGGIGTGSPALSDGIPFLVDFFNELSKDYSICVYSLNPVNSNYVNRRLQIKSPGRKLNAIQRIMWCLLKFRKTSPNQIIHVLWGHPQGFIGLMLKFLYRIPLIIHLQGGDSTYVPEMNYGVFRSKFRTRMIKWVYAQANDIVVLTRYQKEQLARNFDKKTPHIIPYGVKNSKFENVEIELKAPFKLINIGHISPVKNQRFLLDAYHEILKAMDCDLTIIGEDTLDGALTEYCSQLGISAKVKFLGVLSHQETMHILRQSDLLVHTSYYEAQGVVINEAIANGIPVCGTNVGMVADLSEICTLASPIGDKISLVRNITSVLSNQDAYHRIASDGMIWSSQNSMRRTIEKFHELYGKYLN